MANPHVQFEDDIQPVTSTANGVYSLRQVRSATGIGSLSKSSEARLRKHDPEAETTNVEERDYKTKQVSTPQ